MRPHISEEGWEIYILADHCRIWKSIWGLELLKIRPKITEIPLRFLSAFIFYKIFFLYWKALFDYFNATLLLT